MGFDEWGSADNFFDLDPVLGRNGVPEKFHGESSDITTDEALKFIRRQAVVGKPFLSVVWFGSPHVPHQALAGLGPQKVVSSRERRANALQRPLLRTARVAGDVTRTVRQYAL